jgi:hypothetical protein
MKVLFILKHREQDYCGEYGEWGDYSGGKPLKGGLYNSARMIVDALQVEGVRAKLVHVIDNNGIHAEVVKHKADVVFIEGYWVTPDKFDELHKVLPKVKWVIRNHSETPFLANEGIAFGWTLDYLKKPKVYVAANSIRMYEELKLLADLDHSRESKVLLLPNYYIFDFAPFKHEKKDRPLDVGCFGAIRPLKNHVEQAIGALIAANDLGMKLRFHINGNRIEGGADPIKKNLIQLFDKLPKHELVMHPWMEREEFLALLHKMDVVTQVSFSETFNIVLADAVSQHVPVVGSAEIPWLDQGSVADPTSSVDIGEKIRTAYRAPNPLYDDNPNVRNIKAYNKASMSLWLEFLWGV